MIVVLPVSAGVLAVPPAAATDDAAVPLRKGGGAAAPAAGPTKMALKTWVHSLFQVCISTCAGWLVRLQRFMGPQLTPAARLHIAHVLVW